jgi:hypothetical protein
VDLWRAPSAGRLAVLYHLSMPLAIAPAGVYYTIDAKNILKVLRCVDGQMTTFCTDRFRFRPRTV